ncbi:MAG: 4-hydroxyphenylpyruvate dioxygenase [Catenulispora sp.]|nr:4-hydroxyphenylpyruvate dioxygenase [Catenulispora sp.]
MIPVQQNRSAIDPGLTVNHVELYVGDAEARMAEFVTGYGFEHFATTVNRERRSDVVCQGSIALVLTEPRSAGHPAHDFITAHGDAVADIALRTADAARTYELAVSRGARTVSAPSVTEGAGNGVHAVIEAFADVRHSLIQAPAGIGPGPWLPGLGPVEQDSAGVGVGLEAIDHLAVCLPAGSLIPTVSYYETALGFSKVYEERIEVGAQAMASQVVQSGSGGVTLTLIEPDLSATPGQIDAFLSDHCGGGVQHIAFSCSDSVATVGAVSGRGVEFLETPDHYYKTLADRIAPAAHSIAELQGLGILLDQDHDGQLFQIFARSTHPRRTFFLEIIERLGARTFGSGNIKALYEAVEAEQTQTRALS